MAFASTAFRVSAAGQMCTGAAASFVRRGSVATQPVNSGLADRINPHTRTVSQPSPEGRYGFCRGQFFAAIIPEGLPVKPNCSAGEIAQDLQSGLRTLAIGAVMTLVSTEPTLPDSKKKLVFEAFATNSSARTLNGELDL